jgi:hypothetical protein
MKDILSQNPAQFCRKCSLIGSFLLLFQFTFGLFGSLPWVDNDRKYAGFLFVFNLKNKGQSKIYKELKSIVDKQIVGKLIVAF